MLISGRGFFIVIAALAFDALIGDPDWLWRRLGHPVALIGALIGYLDRRFNREDRSQQQRKLAGIACTAAVVAVSGSVGVLVQTTVQQLPMGNLVLALIASIFIAQRSLYQHVARVRSAFAEGGLAGARKAVAMIVGRDPEQLDEAGVCRAAIESCAENFSDGVVAPVFWLALLGLPGLIAYKSINTADSMIGHRSERHESFGWAAARLDDLVNLIPATIVGLAACGRGADRRGDDRRVITGGKARCLKTSFAECRLAGKCDGRRAGSGAGRTAPLRYTYGRRSLSERRSDQPGRARRYRARARSLRCGVLHRSGWLRRTGIGGLTAACDGQNSLDIQIRFQMIGQRIERGIDFDGVGERRNNPEIGEPRFSKGVTGEQPVDVGALHPSVGRARAVGAPVDRHHRPCAIGAFTVAEVNFIPLDGGPGCAMRAFDQPG